MRSPPRVPSPTPRPAAPPPPPAPSSVRRYPVLVVMSDWALRQMLAAFLEEEGYQTATVADVPACLTYLARHRRPHIVMLYPRLFGAHGEQVLRYLRGNPPLRRRVSVLLMIADLSSDLPLAERYKSLIDGVLELPFAPDGLLGRVADCAAKLAARLARRGK